MLLILHGLRIGTGRPRWHDLHTALHWLTGWVQPSRRDGPGRPEDAASVTEGRERYQGGINIALVSVVRYYFYW